MISIDIMILVVIVAALLFGFLVFSEPEDEDEFHYLWDEREVDEEIIYRAGNRVLTYHMLEESRGAIIDFEDIGRDKALEVAQHFYQKGLEAREKGAREKATDLFQQVHQISPKWLAPLHQLAELYLEKGEDDFAFEAYEDLSILFPQGYKDTITALFTLDLERKGSLREGAFKQLKNSLNLPVEARITALKSMLERLPNYAPVYLALIKSTNDQDSRRKLIHQGLAGIADDQTYQQLLIEKAILDAEEGLEYEAIYVLGDLILNEQTTAGAQMKAGQVLSKIISS